MDVYNIVTGVLGVDGKVRGGEFDFKCPVHDDRRPSAGINLESGLWKCLACGASGDLAALAMVVKQTDRAAAMRLVRPNTPEALTLAVQRAARSALQGLKRGAFTPVLPQGYPSEPLDYLRGRGFTDETLRMYEAGYVKEEKLQKPEGKAFHIRDYIALPIRDSKGHLLSYVYRATGGQQLRYVYTPGTPLGSLWFGLHLQDQPGSIVVTEGALDSMWVRQCGFPAVAILGASINPEAKIKLLLPYRQAILFMDRDGAGTQAVRKLGPMLNGRMAVFVARYPKNVQAKDPAELTPDQVRRAIERAIAFQEWNAISCRKVS